MGWKGWEKFLPNVTGSKPKAKQKYNAEATFIDGHYFASKKEANRYQTHQLALKSGLITDLRLQTPFALNVGTTTIGYYRADFTYQENGVMVVEDVKGYRPAFYIWKKKHFEAQYGIPIREV